VDASPVLIELAQTIYGIIAAAAADDLPMG
jgi:hypothetical protein